MSLINEWVEIFYYLRPTIASNGSVIHCPNDQFKHQNFSWGIKHEHGNKYRTLVIEIDRCCIKIKQSTTDFTC